MKNIALVAIVLLSLLAILACAGNNAPTELTVVQKLHPTLNCEQCHGTKTPSAPARDTACLTPGCHDRPDLVKATAKYTHNPHTSLHYSTDVDCFACHREHRPSTVTCGFCHPENKYPALK